MFLLDPQKRNTQPRRNERNIYKNRALLFSHSATAYRIPLTMLTGWLLLTIFDAKIVRN